MTFRREIMFSSQRDNWKTPTRFLEELDKEFEFDFDPCPPNAPFDGLLVDWGMKNFVNPPYSNWQAWVKKGVEQWKQGKLVIFLLKAATDTIAFHDLILPYATEIRFIKGRLHFDDHKNPAPFPSMVVIFK